MSKGDLDNAACRADAAIEVTEFRQAAERGLYDGRLVAREYDDDFFPSWGQEGMERDRTEREDDTEEAKTRQQQSGWRSTRGRVAMETNEGSKVEPQTPDPLRPLLISCHVRQSTRPGGS